MCECPATRVAGHFSGGPEGIRTPDLLDANEARYQLRHRPGNLVNTITSHSPRRTPATRGKRERPPYAENRMQRGGERR